MSDTRGKRRDSSMAQCEVRYSLELARGSSHIASALTATTLNAAITEVVDGFVQQYGKDDVSMFLKLLAVRLDERQNSAAASAVRHLDAFGSVPPSAPSVKRSRAPR